MAYVQVPNDLNRMERGRLWRAELSGHGALTSITAQLKEAARGAEKQEESERQKQHKSHEDR